MPFFGHAKIDVFVSQTLRAMRQGEYAVGNRRITYRGGLPPCETHYGPVVRAEGRIDGWYYGAHVFALDFDKKRITDFGYAGFSPSTATTIGGWEAACKHLFRGKFPYDLFYNYTRWCRDFKDRWNRFHFNNFRMARVFEGVFARFREQVPWARREEGAWWFYWEKYDAAMTEVLYDTLQHLRSDQNWRYFDYDWVDACWTRRFQNADAERRWMLRERQRAKRLLRKAA